MSTIKNFSKRKDKIAFESAKKKISILKLNGIECISKYFNAIWGGENKRTK